MTQGNYNLKRNIHALSNALLRPTQCLKRLTHPWVAGATVLPPFNQWEGVSSLCEITSPISPPEDSHLHGNNPRRPIDLAMKLLTMTCHVSACIHSFFHFRNNYWGFPGGSVEKDPPAKRYEHMRYAIFYGIWDMPPAGDMSSTPGWGRSHVPQSNQVCVLQLPSTWPQLLKPTRLRAHALQQGKPPQWETCASHPEKRQK